MNFRRRRECLRFKKNELGKDIFAQWEKGKNHIFIENCKEQGIYSIFTTSIQEYSSDCSEPVELWHFYFWGNVVMPKKVERGSTYKVILNF